MPQGRIFLPVSAALACASLAFACSAGTASKSDPSQTLAGGAGGTSGSGTSGTGATSGAGTGGSGTSGSGSGTSGSSNGTAGAGTSGSGAGGSSGSGQAGTGNTGGYLGCDPNGPNGEAFYDDFEDGELACPEWLPSDATILPLWSITTDGTSKVLTASSSATDGPILAAGDYLWTDVTIEAQVKFTGSIGMAMIFARVQDANNYYDLYLDGTNLIFRGKTTAGGSGTSLSTGATNKVKTEPLGITQTAGTWYTLKLKIAGKAVTGSLNGMDLINIPDITTSDYVGSTSQYVPSGGIGVGAKGAVEFDNVKVTVP